MGDLLLTSHEKKQIRQIQIDIEELTAKGHVVGEKLDKSVDLYEQVELLNKMIDINNNIRALSEQRAKVIADAHKRMLS